jgi:release factor glutamine methyltransferase
VNRKEALARSRKSLAESHVEDAPLEGELLLRHVLGVSRARLFLDLEQELHPSQEAELRRLIERRNSGEPPAYITGHREFYGLDFYVDRRVLIPRPESELLVEKAINLVQHHPIATMADIGTGCGAIAISLAINLPGVKIYATDISSAALEVARINCRKHGVLDRVKLLQGDMLEPLPAPVDLLVANLPYVRGAELPRTGPLSFEPELALNGGQDGLAVINRLCQQASEKLRPGGCLLMEIGGKIQAEIVKTSLHNISPSARIDFFRDLNNIERVASLRV